QVGEIVFLLSRHPMFADEPGLLPGQMLLALVPDSLWWSVCYTHRDSGETSRELSFRAGAPTDVLPCGIGQHVFGRHRENVRNVPLTGTAAPRNRPDHLNTARVHFEVTRNTDRPDKFASSQP